MNALNPAGFQGKSIAHEPIAPLPHNHPEMLIPWRLLVALFVIMPGLTPFPCITTMDLSSDLRGDHVAGWGSSERITKGPSW